MMATIADYLGSGVRIGKELSTREAQCLRYVMLGFTDKEIADFLEISPRTVQSFMTKSQIKLGAKNRTHSVAIFISKKLGVNLKDVFEN